MGRRELLMAVSADPSFAVVSGVAAFTGMKAGDKDGLQRLHARKPSFSASVGLR